MPTAPNMSGATHRLKRLGLSLTIHEAYRSDLRLHPGTCGELPGGYHITPAAALPAPKFGRGLGTALRAPLPRR
jgi:hypothetical protein